MYLLSLFVNINIYISLEIYFKQVHNPLILNFEMVTLILEIDIGGID